jgi:hypothetical protein
MRNSRTVIADPYICEKLWKTYIPEKTVSDLWEFRMCFHQHFRNHFRFFIIEDRNDILGLLPLSYIDDLNTHAFFPAEIWNNKTWLERTPIYAENHQTFTELLLSCPESIYLRYMENAGEYMPEQMELDEIGYVLYPARLGFDKANYFKRFSNKKIKCILKNIKSITDIGVKFHINRTADYELLVDMSIERYGDNSYLRDIRFRNSFRDIVTFLHKSGYLKMISLELDGKTVAVDIGALYKGVYTVFLGGVFSCIPGLAKVMNMYHIDYALNNRVLKLDFLCGDFNWKKLWHLDQEPLFKFLSPELEDTVYPSYNSVLHHSIAEEIEAF